MGPRWIDFNTEAISSVTIAIIPPTAADTFFITTAYQDPSAGAAKGVDVSHRGAEIRLYEGAERLLRFHLDRGYRVEKSLPLRWSEPEFSPFLDRMGSW